MASTYSTSLKLELIGDGDQSGIWGQTTNNNLGTLLEQAIAGVVSITMLDANYTLTNFNGVSDESRNAVIVATGTNTNVRDIIAPLVEKTYIVKNSTTGGYAVRIIGASGTGVTIPNGVTTTVYCDGTNFYNINDASIGNYTINGNGTVTGNLAVTGTTTFTGAVTANVANATTATITNLTSSNAAFSGTPTAPTAANGTNSTQIATTAFVQNFAGTLGTMSTQNANAVNITGGTISGVSGSNPSMSVGNANSATYAVTQSIGTNNTTIATTAFVQSAAGLGYGQTWQSFNSSQRSLNTDYTNSTGKPIMVAVSGIFNGGQYIAWYIDGVNVISTGVHAATEQDSITTIVPPGSTYRLYATDSFYGGIAPTWSELR